MSYRNSEIEDIEKDNISSSTDTEVILNGMYYIIDRDDNIYFIKEKIGQVDIFRGINFYYKKSFEPYISVKYFKKVPVKSTLYPENRIILIWSDYAKRLEIWQYNEEKEVQVGAIEYSDDKVQWTYVSKANKYIIINYDKKEKIAVYDIRGNMLWHRWLSSAIYNESIRAITGIEGNSIYYIYLKDDGTIEKTKIIKFDDIFEYPDIIKSYSIKYGIPKKPGYVKILLYDIKTNDIIEQFIFRGMVSSVAENYKRDIAIGSLDGTIGIRTHDGKKYYINPHFGRLSDSPGRYYGCKCPPCPKWISRYRPKLYNEK